MPPTADPYRGLATALRDLALLAGGCWGIAFRNLATGEGVELAANEVFPGASIAKVGLLLEVLRQVEAGTLRLDDEVTVNVQDEENARLGSGILVHLHRGLRVTLGDLCELAINLSDNVASNLLIERVGMDAVNSNLAAYGVQSTRLNHRFEDFVALRSPEQNPVTAAELAGIFSRLYRRELPASNLALGYLRRCSAGTRLPLYLPDTARTYHKTGTLRGIVHDGGIVEGPSGAYVLVCLSSQGENNIVATQAIAQMSRAVWKAFGSSAES
ncbi:MAG: serine hydrolase [Chloroflexota bacterium]